jgi:hypothetical protein
MLQIKHCVYSFIKCHATDYDINLAQMRRGLNVWCPALWHSATHSLPSKLVLYRFINTVIVAACMVQLGNDTSEIRVFLKLFSPMSIEHKSFSQLDS